MDATHFHLILTHFPIVGTFIGIGILVYGQISRDDSIKKVALSVFIIMSLLTIPVFLTGEGAEESVEHLAGVSKSIIEEHEELASIAIWIMGLLGVISLVGLYSIIKKRSYSKLLNSIILIVSLVTFGLFAKVGNLGGQIRHTEIRKNSTNVQIENKDDVINHNEDREEDDDD